ncbi:MAG: hypothetical protein LJE62_03835, partial [Silicimonas sp.]|nr:hypothetical protein [Silicimonas sp.]
LLDCRVKSGCQVLATCSGISESDLEVVRHEIAQTFHMPMSERKNAIRFAPMYCNEFFNEYWRTLTS